MTGAPGVVRFALAQVNPTVGDLEGNAQLVLDCLAEARRAGAQVVVFPELVLSGYPPEDLLLRDQFVHDCGRALDRVAAGAQGLVAVVGVPLDLGEGVTNAAAVLAEGRVQAVYRKIWLPNYAVFDEERYFQAGDAILVLELPGVRVGVNICEDIWEPCGPTEAAALRGGADVVVNLSMSPYHLRKGAERERMLARRGRDAGAFIVYVNGVGGQDELVFDGNSVVIGPSGELLARGPQFEEALLFIDLDPAAARAARGEGSVTDAWGVERVAIGPEAFVSGAGAVARGVTETAEPGVPSGDCAPQPATVLPALDELGEIYAAVRLGVRDYVHKNGFDHVVIGMSGGIDSALTACFAVDALGADHVTAVSMPSRYSSAGTQSDARTISQNLGVQFLELPIENLFTAYLQALGPSFADAPPNEAEENIQARIRGNLLMALSNKFGWLVLTTGNKSEMAVGYATLYGDMAGGFAVVKDLPKTLVYELSRYRNSLGSGGGPIPVSIIDRSPSAELRADQTDQDSLPPYDLLDAIIEAYVVRDEGVEHIVAGGLPRAEVERVARMIDRNEYKRRQAAPGPRVTLKAFGKDRRLPITNRYRG